MPRLTAPQLLWTGVGVLAVGFIAGVVTRATMERPVYGPFGPTMGSSSWGYGFGTTVSEALIVVGAVLFGGGLVVAALDRSPRPPQQPGALQYQGVPYAGPGPHGPVPGPQAPVAGPYGPQPTAPGTYAAAPTTPYPATAAPQYLAAPAAQYPGAAQYPTAPSAPYPAAPTGPYPTAPGGQHPAPPTGPYPTVPTSPSAQPADPTQGGAGPDDDPS